MKVAIKTRVLHFFLFALDRLNESLGLLRCLKLQKLKIELVDNLKVHRKTGEIQIKK